MSRLVLWDMDGTLSNDADRHPLYLAGDYATYFSYESQMADLPFQEARALFDAEIASGSEVAVLTARLERNRKATEDWLAAHDFRPENMYHIGLRPEEDKDVRPPEWKVSVLREVIDLGYFDEVVMVEDDPRVQSLILSELGPEHLIPVTWGVTNRV